MEFILKLKQILVYAPFVGWILWVVVRIKENHQRIEFLIESIEKHFNDERDEKVEERDYRNNVCLKLDSINQNMNSIRIDLEVLHERVKSNTPV